MTFTNDDLKRLKDWLEWPENQTATTCDRVRRLIARLEAAEKVVSLAVQYTLIADEVVPIGEAVEVWRKSAGREGL